MFGATKKELLRSLSWPALSGVKIEERAGSPRSGVSYIFIARRRFMSILSRNPSVDSHF